MSFDDWFFSWPVILAAIAFVAAARIFHDWVLGRDPGDE